MNPILIDVYAHVVENKALVLAPTPTESGRERIVAARTKPPWVRDKRMAGGRGKNYSVNFPLRDGIDDKSYQGIFKPLMQEIMDRYAPYLSRP